jgi:hypothetical protein
MNGVRSALVWALVMTSCARPSVPTATHESVSVAAVPGATGAAPDAGWREESLADLLAAFPLSDALAVNASLMHERLLASNSPPLLPQRQPWMKFFGPSEDTDWPLRDLDWIVIDLSPPSKVIVHHHPSDTLVDAAIDAVARSSDGGSRYEDDAGAKGARWTTPYEDLVFLRPKSGIFAIASPDQAATWAKLASDAPSRPFASHEAMRFVVHHSRTALGVATLSSMTELRMWLIARDDGDADLVGEGDCRSADDAPRVAGQLNATIAALRSHFLIRMQRIRVLDAASFTPDGSKVTSHTTIQAADFERFLRVVEGYLLNK